VGKKVRFITTSNDVIHSWWVPAFGVKRDAVPGFLREFWATVEKTGTYRGQCSELCGKEHGFMPVVVNVVTQRSLPPGWRPSGGRQTGRSS
jgi:cytochrome c oxidase subunit 2